ncbi:MAG TPA: transporter [Ideonella sp.]|nr:transporter [Ideonella sp.]
MTPLFRTRLRLLMGAGLVAAGTASQAIDIDAGDYTALPAGTTVGVLYAQHAERNRLYASDQRVPGSNGLDSEIGVLRLIHFMKLGDYTVDPQMLLPFGRLEARGDLGPVLGKGSGTADLILAATVWTLEDPANRRYFGITPFLYAPTGSYDAAKPLNLGENRWKYALQAAYIHGVGAKLTFDFAADITAYGRNDKATPAGDELTQKPTLQFQGFVRYAMSPAWDLRAGLSHARTGETRLSGVARNDDAQITKMQLGSAVFVGAKTQLLATWGRDLKVDNGFKESSRLNLRLLQIF